MLRNCRVIVISCYKDKEVSQCLLINTFSHMSLYMYNKKAVLNRWRFKKYDIYCIVYHSICLKQCVSVLVLGAPALQVLDVSLTLNPTLQIQMISSLSGFNRA